MARRRINHGKKGTKQSAQKTTLWSFFGRFWKGIAVAEQKEERRVAEVKEIEDMTFNQVTNKQPKLRLRLKK